MKKKIMGRKLSRGRGARKALFRSLIRALVEHGAIKTTKAKAKAIQADVDKLINLAKEEGVVKRRQVYARLGNDKETTNSLFAIAKSNFPKRSGGYTRIINLPVRRGDAAPIVRLEWVEEVGTRSKVKSDESEKKARKQGKIGLAGKVKSRFGKKETGKKEIKKNK